MKFIKSVIVLALIAIIGLISISPDKIDEQQELYLDQEIANDSYAQLSAISGNNFFVLPIISHSAEKTLQNIDPSYLGINVKDILESALDSSAARFSHGDHYVVPVRSGRNNLCFMADERMVHESFLSKTSTEYDFDERMIIHEMAHCQYRFSDGEIGGFDEILEANFAEHIMKVAVDKSDQFRVTASELTGEFVELHHEIYADLFTIAFFEIVKKDGKAGPTIAKFRNDAFIHSRDIVHWTSPHIAGFSERISGIRIDEPLFPALDQAVKLYMLDNLSKMGPEEFLELMVIIGRSEAENRKELSLSDFDANQELQAWVAQVFKNSEI